MELSLDLFYEKFGDEDDLDLFTYTPPWQKEEENSETKETRENQVDANEWFEKDVKPTYISMLEELKAEAERGKRDQETKEEEMKELITGLDDMTYELAQEVRMASKDIRAAKRLCNHWKELS